MDILAAADYRAALPSMPDKPRDLSESAVTAVWDDELATEMRNHGLAVEEEAVASSLLPDLAGRAP